LKEVSDAAAEILGIPFSVSTWRDQRARTYGVIDFIGQYAPDLRCAFESIVRYQRLVSDRTRFSLTIQGDEALFEHDLSGIPGVAGRHPNEFTMAVIVRRMRDLAAPDFAPLRVWFAHAAPADTTELRRYFGVENITFGAENNGFAFPEALLDRPIASANADLLRVLDEQPGFSCRPCRSPIRAWPCASRSPRESKTASRTCEPSRRVSRRARARFNAACANTARPSKTWSRTCAAAWH